MNKTDRNILFRFSYYFIVIIIIYMINLYDLFMLFNKQLNSQLNN